MRFLPATSAAEADSAIDRMIATEAAHGPGFWALERKAVGAFLGIAIPLMRALWHLTRGVCHER
jgi:hypothetical protein